MSCWPSGKVATQEARPHVSLRFRNRILCIKSLTLRPTVSLATGATASPRLPRPHLTPHDADRDGVGTRLEHQPHLTSDLNVHVKVNCPVRLCLQCHLMRPPTSATGPDTNKKRTMKGTTNEHPRTRLRGKQTKKHTFMKAGSALSASKERLSMQHRKRFHNGQTRHCKNKLERLANSKRRQINYPRPRRSNSVTSVGQHGCLRTKPHHPRTSLRTSCKAVTSNLCVRLCCAFVHTKRNVMRSAWQESRLTITEAEFKTDTVLSATDHSREGRRKRSCFVFFVFGDEGCIKTHYQCKNVYDLKKIKERKAKAMLRHFLHTFIQNKGHCFISTGAGVPPLPKNSQTRRSRRQRSSCRCCCPRLHGCRCTPVFPRPVARGERAGSTDQNAFTSENRVLNTSSVGRPINSWQ